MNRIRFHELNTRSNLSERRALKEFLRNLFYSEGYKVNTVDIIFCTDKYLLNLNKRHLKHDYYTDTLTFLISNQPGIIGEIYISSPRVRINAKSYNCSYQEELCRVIIHGCLHLCGYKDHPKAAFYKMETIQENYLDKWKVSRET